MTGRFAKASDLRSDNLRIRLFVILLIVFTANAGAWAWALVAFHQYPLLLGTAMLAYTFGLRHAVDADHIAAIDNVTRKLMQEGKRPVGVGFFFSLGHSTIVILASAGVAATAITLNEHVDVLKTVGTLVSMLFLLLIAGMNIVILCNIYKTFQSVRAGREYGEDELNALLASRGLLARIFRPLFGMIRKSWHMYPLGFLFGLGFDTATEVGVLGISAVAATRGMPIWSIMVFPALFTAGMSLVDTADGILMLGAYGWAFVKPARKLYYNMTITLVSIVVALAVGGIEALGLIGSQFNLSGRFWAAVRDVNDHFGTVGFFVIGLFVASWGIAAVVYRLKGYDQMDDDLVPAPGE